MITDVHCDHIKTNQCECASSFPLSTFHPFGRKPQLLGFGASRVQIGWQWTDLCREGARYIDIVMPRRGVVGHCLIGGKFFRTT